MQKEIAAQGFENIDMPGNIFALPNGHKLKNGGRRSNICAEWYHCIVENKYDYTVTGNESDGSRKDEKAIRMDQQEIFHRLSGQFQPNNVTEFFFYDPSLTIFFG